MLIFLLSILFAILVTLLEEILFIQPQGFYLAFLLDRRGANLLPGLISTAASLFLLVMLAWLALSLPRKLRLPLLFVYLLAVVAESGYQKVFHRWFSVIDLQTALSAPVGMWQSAAAVYLTTTTLALTALYLLLLLPPRPRNARPLVPAAGAGLFLAVNVLLQLSGASINWGSSIPQFYHTAARWAFSDARATQRETVPSFVSPAPDNNIILIIDESIRADHLSLNGYARPSKPTLEELAEYKKTVYKYL